jgi:hypothetical protein
MGTNLYTQEIDAKWAEYYSLRDKIDPLLENYPDSIKDYIARRIVWLKTDYDKAQIVNEIIDSLDSKLSIGENKRIVDSVISRYTGKEFNGHIENWDLESIALDLTYSREPEIIRDFLSQYGRELERINPKLYQELAEYAGLVEPDKPSTDNTDSKPMASTSQGITQDIAITVDTGVNASTEPEKVDVDIEVDIPIDGDTSVDMKPDKPEPETPKPSIRKPEVVFDASRGRDVFVFVDKRGVRVSKTSVYTYRKKMYRIARKILATHRNHIGLSILEFLESRETLVIGDRP